MGLDGGTKITRSDVLRGQSWRLSNADDSRSTRGGAVSTSETFSERRLDKNTAKRIRWSTCALSEQPLSCPIVADFKGNLYNQEAFLKFLLQRKGIFENEADRHHYTNLMHTQRRRLDHLKRRRDAFELKIQDGDFKEGLLSCPLSGDSCLSVPFSALASCGHVCSSRAIDEMKDRHCMLCSMAFESEDIVPLNSDAVFQSKERTIVTGLKEKKQRSDRKRDSVIEEVNSNKRSKTPTKKTT